MPLFDVKTALRFVCLSVCCRHWHCHCHCHCCCCCSAVFLNIKYFQLNGAAQPKRQSFILMWNVLSICMPLPRLSLIIFIPCYRAAIKYKCFFTCNCFAFFPSFHFNVLALTYSAFCFCFFFLFFETLIHILVLSRVFILFLFFLSFFVYDFVHIHHHNDITLMQFISSHSCQTQVWSREHTLFFMYVLLFFSRFLSPLSTEKNTHQQW